MSRPFLPYHLSSDISIIKIDILPRFIFTQVKRSTIKCVIIVTILNKDIENRYILKISSLGVFGLQRVGLRGQGRENES